MADFQSKIHKGFFVNQNKRIERLIESRRQKISKTDSIVPDSVVTKIEGRRVIEIDILIQNLKCVTCSEKIHLCDIVEEKIYGLGSVFRILCYKCESVTDVPTGKRDEKGAFHANYKVTTGKYKPIFFLNVQ